MHSPNVQGVIDSLLQRCVEGEAGIPGVAAVAGNRDRDIYVGAAGVRRRGDPPTMTPDSLLALFSLTKAITATAALQFYQEGRLDLDAPAREYAPELARVQVLEGFADDGAPRLRPPLREITTRMLLTHTAGFGYEFFNLQYWRLKTERAQLNPRLGMKEGLQIPLLFEPGARWEYGLNVDWAGQVVEGVAGDTLDNVFRKRIFAPLEMRDTAFVPNAEQLARRASMHELDASGALVPIDFQLPTTPQVFMGGGALFGTVLDYMKFLRMWLNDGAGPAGRVLEARTVDYAARNHIGDLAVAALPGVNAALTRDVEFFPGVRKSWALSFLRNEEDLPTGRPAGSLAWAGLGNLYFWLDRKNGVAGVWAAQYFPFMDERAWRAFEAFETEVYRSIG